VNRPYSRAGLCNISLTFQYISGSVTLKEGGRCRDDRRGEDYKDSDRYSAGNVMLPLMTMNK